MTDKEQLEQLAHDEGIPIDYVDFTGNRLCGLYIDGSIAIKKGMNTSKTTDVLAEELGHHFTTVGNIIEMQNESDIKQERTARLWAYDKRIGLQSLIKAYKHGCQDLHSTADFLNVTEEFLQEAIDCYREKYGEKVVVDEYTIQFEPHLQVISPYDEVIIVYTRNRKNISREEKMRLARIILSDDED